MNNTYESRAVLRAEDVEFVEAFWVLVKRHSDSCRVFFYEGTNKRPEYVELAIYASRADFLDSLMDRFLPGGCELGVSAYLHDGAVCIDVAELLDIQDGVYNYARGIWALRPDGLPEDW